MSSTLQEWTIGSGIDPAIAQLNVESLFRPTEIARRLGWAKYRHTEGWWSQGVDIATGKPSPFGQFKPAKPFPFADREAKYLTPKGTYDVIALQMPDSEYWQKVAADPSIPIVVTEGAKKAGAALTCGIPALALCGVEMGSTSSDGGKKQRELVPNLAALAVPGREVAIAYDTDLSQKLPVRIALRTQAKALIAQGCIVRVASWDERHKGLDDLKVACGADAVRAAIKGAESFEKWDKRWRKIERAEAAAAALRCTLEPEVRVNQRYLDPAILPELLPADILALSSACNTGKTELLKAIIAWHKKRYPDAWVLIVGYRNSLLFQTGERLKLPHITQIEGDYPGNSAYGIKQAQAALLCLDSLPKVPWDNLPANSLIIHDEAEAVASHGLGGGTLGDRQNEILELWRSVATRVLATGGNLILAEDSLSNLSLNFYSELAGDRPIRLIQNDWKPERTASLSTSGSSGFVAKICNELKDGLQVLVSTDSQRFGEKLAWVAESYGFKVFRLDSKTAETKEAKFFQHKPDEFIELHKPQLIILSPTAESGSSINSLGWHLRANLTSADTRRQYQLLHRLRNPESIAILTKPRGIIADTEWETNPKALIKSWALQARHTAILSGIEQDLSAQDWSSEAQQQLKRLESSLKGEDETALFWERHRANFKARENLLKQDMSGNLEAYLQQRGYTIEHVSYPGCKSTSELLKIAQADIEAETASLLFKSPGGQTEAQAIAVLRSSATYAQKLNAEKSLLQAKLPEAPLSEDFLLKACVEDRGRGLKREVLLFTCQNPELAKKLDKASYKGQLSKGFVARWRISSHTAKADLFQQSGIDAILALEGTETELSEEDPRVESFRAWALNNKAAIWRNFQLNIKPQQTGIEILSKFIRRFGCELKQARRVGARGQQARLWIVKAKLKSEYRQKISEASKRKWADDLRQSDKPVVTISYKENTPLEIVTTKSDPPPDTPPYKTGDVVLFSLDGSKCRVQQVKGRVIELRRLDEPVSTLKFDALPSDLRAIA